MIIVNMKDGLGNQLFEYGFAKHLQKLTGDKKICLNNFFFDGKRRRSYSLHHFRLSPDVVVPGKLGQYWYTFWYMVRLFFCYPKVFIRWMISNDRPADDKTFAHSAKKGMYVHFNTFHKFDIPAAKTRNKYIYGNYENYAYIENVLPELREDFQIIHAPSEANRKMIEELSSQEAVCVHIRRGDYLDPRWASLQVCTFAYYQKAMNEIQQRRPKVKFYVFSNSHEDLEWIKENYHFDQEVSYVDLDNPDYEELRLMTCCSHFVISNSTFSWWAAVLAKAENKIVVTPATWIKGKDNCEGMYWPDWIKINV